MSTSVWYYVDQQQQRQGPVAAETIREAYRTRQLDGESLVWREGMSQWQPLRQFELEFDLEDEPASLVMPPPMAEATAVPSSPYAPPMAPVASSDYDGQATDIVYAGFWRRAAALCVDGLIVATVNYALFFVLILVAGAGSAFAMNRDPGQLDPASMALVFGIYIIGPIVSALYFVLQESSEAQATLGKRLLGIKVTDAQGRRLGRGHALGRWVSHLICYVTLYIGYVVAAFTQRKQGLHDMVAGTLVVDQYAYTDRPDLQKRELGGCLVAFIVVFFAFILLSLLAVGAAFFALADGLGGIR